MPRKTKKQKERTSKRINKPGGAQEPVNREFEFTFKSNGKRFVENFKFKKDDNSLYSADTRFTKRDLLKTIILAGGILLLEMMIYWAWFK